MKFFFNANQINKALNVTVINFFLCFISVTNIFSQIPNYLAPNLLVGYWPFDGTANDMSGNGNNAILNGPTYTYDREGKPNKALRFSNKTDLLTIPPSFNSPLDSNFTISFWYKSNIRTRMDFFNLNDSNLFQNNFNLIFNNGVGLGSSGILGFWNSAGSNNISVGTAGNFTDNTWHNLLIKRDSGFITIFLDGLQTSSNSYYNSVIGLNNSITLSDALFPFYGDIDDLIIYERALNNAEINTLVNNSNAIPYIISPKVTDSYFINDTVQIKWANAVGYDTISIQYSLNNGVNWITIANNIAVNTNTFTWVAPNNPGADCIIRIVNANNPIMYATSDKFLISKYQWQLVNSNNAFSARDGMKGYVFNNSMYMMGGWNPLDPINYPHITNNEVWQSNDGNSWTLIDTADWEGRHIFGSLIHDNKMWVVGGDQLHGHFQKDVWNTLDGLNWNKVCDSVPWGDRMTHMTCSFDGKIWVMGGQKILGWGNTLDTEYNDVWNSVDGITWNLVTAAAPWNPRGQIDKICVFNNKMWVIGGGTYNWDRKYYNDIWNSSDGINWTLVTNMAQWEAREFHEVIVYDNAIWIIGGYDGISGNRKDVWYSEDGNTWHELKNTPWPERHATSVFNYNHSLWVVAGNMWNDSWRLNNLVCPNVISPISTTTVLAGNSVAFVSSYASGLATYTWQVKNGQAWQNVLNTTIISGANNDTLIINTALINNNGEIFRCIVENGSCSDTTNSSILKVIEPNGITENRIESGLQVYPIPAKDILSIIVPENLVNYNFTIIDQLGRSVLTGKLQENSNAINIEKLSSGYYVIILDARKDLAFKIIKL